MKSKQEELAEFMKSAFGAETLDRIMDGALTVAEKNVERYAAMARKQYDAYIAVGFAPENAFALLTLTLAMGNPWKRVT